MRAALGRVEDRLLELEMLLEVASPEEPGPPGCRVRALAFVAQARVADMRREFEAALVCLGASR
jgi:hypothetical protein